MAIEKVKVPELGDTDDVEVIELLISVGQSVAVDESLLVLESDKAAMEVPAPVAGVVKSIAIKLGDKVNSGADICTVEVEAGAGAAGDDKGADAGGGAKGADAGSDAKGADAAGGDKDAAGAAVGAAGGEGATGEQGAADRKGAADERGATDERGAADGKDAKDAKSATASSAAEKAKQAAGKPASSKKSKGSTSTSDFDLLEGQSEVWDDSKQIQRAKGIYAGPAVRKLARELGVNLERITGTGAKGRIIKEDLHEFVKRCVNAASADGSAGATISTIPDIDFTRFGEVKKIKLNKIQKLTATNMQRSWQNIPHVAQFHEADVTDLEVFRAEEAEQRGVKLTFLPFLLKACAKALQEYPQFNVSLHSSGEHLYQKQYIHIGVAVATDAGLVVPVIRDVDKKSIWQLADEIKEMSSKARARKLTREAMEGGCFTISSLGAIGGTGFIPVINPPEVAILGIGATDHKPVYIDGEFEARVMLPLTLSYDHRAVNGVDGGMFASYLAELLSDIRYMLL
ncbi:MAG: 2-oxo acid dehydrogenase subunit E2 [Pseudohongiellaceae bacterium]